MQAAERAAEEARRVAENIEMNRIRSQEVEQQRLDKLAKDQKLVSNLLIVKGLSEQ